MANISAGRDEPLTLIRILSPPSEPEKKADQPQPSFNKKVKKMVEQAKVTIDLLPLTPEARASAKLTHGCVRCDKEGFKSSVCSKCKHAHYCSRECQKADWPKHKLLCRPPNPEAEMFESKTLTLSTRAMAVPALCNHILYLAHRILHLATHPQNSHAFVIFFTWDLIPVQTPKEWFSNTPAKPGRQRHMLRLVNVYLNPRDKIERGMLDMLKSRRHPERVAGRISEPEHIFVDIVFACERSKDMYQVAGYSRTFWPELQVQHKLLDTVMPKRAEQATKETGLTFEHWLIKEINQAIVLDTQNAWKLRTRLQNDD